MDIALIITGSILSILGLIGCLVPVLPGPPLNYVALLLLHFTKTPSFSVKFLIWTLLLTILVVVLDYFIPMAGTKKFGGSKYGIWGCIAGMIIGMIYFPPAGLIVGGFAGAVLGELLSGKTIKIALKAGMGSFIGFAVGTIAKLIVSGLFCYYFVDALM